MPKKGFGPFDFYPRSPCGERLTMSHLCQWNVGISIHALLAESDQTSLVVIGTNCVFLSTLSLRRATLCWCWGYRLRYHFYPRSPCGERQTYGALKHVHQTISIHALLAESDLNCSRKGLAILLFLSTLSLRRATGRYQIPSRLHHHFYPRSPCGERPQCRTFANGM